MRATVFSPSHARLNLVGDGDPGETGITTTNSIPIAVIGDGTPE